MNEPRIIMLTEFIDQKLRKERELEFYQKELEKLQEKMYWLRREIDLTNTIIQLVQTENVIDFKEKLLERKDNEQK